MLAWTSDQREYNYTKAMNDSISAGYLERPHTADWELEVWAPDFPGLLGKAAEGMYSLMGVVPDQDCLEERMLSLEAADLEGLLVSFLTELLFLCDSEGRVCRPGKIIMDGTRLQAVIFCAGVAERVKEIKAVTWHNLVIRFANGQYRAVIVFDV